jgi:hypothetical protein
VPRPERDTRRCPRAAIATATAAAASLILTAGAAGGPSSESATVLVSTTGDHSELVRSVRITNPTERARRVVMSMGPSQLPSLAPGDRLHLTAELEVSTDCPRPSFRCVGRPYRYSPQVRAQLVLAGSPRAIEPSVPLSKAKHTSCRQRSPHRVHHCMFVFSRVNYAVPDPESLPCSPGACFVNLLVDAHRRAARGRDRLLIGADEPHGEVEQDRGRINAVRIHPTPGTPLSERQTMVASRERATRLVPLGRHRRAVVYSQELDSLKSGEQLAVSARMRSGVGRLGRDARITSRLVLARTRHSTRPARLAKRIASTHGEIAEANGFNCTRPHSPCPTRKVGVMSINEDAATFEGDPVPLYVNLVVTAASRPPGSLKRNVVRINDTGRLKVVRYPAGLRG